MFKELLNCSVDELQQYAEKMSLTLKEENVELFIRTLWKRVPELNVEQEKNIHRLGRKILKQFNN